MEGKSADEKDTKIASTNNPPPYCEAENNKKAPAVIEKPMPIPPPPVHPQVNAPPPPPPAPPAQPVPFASDEKKVEEKKNSAGEIIIDSKHPLAKGSSVEAPTITMETFQGNSGGLQGWFKGVFGSSSSKYLNDSQSSDLEAYMILGDKRQMKVPFGDRRLRYGLKQLMKKKKSSTLDDYYKLPKHIHKAMGEAMRGASVKDARERVCLCFDVLSLGDKPKEEHLLVFFLASGKPVEPIHFKDAVGRKYLVPFHLVQSWEVSFQHHLYM